MPTPKRSPQWSDNVDALLHGVREWLDSGASTPSEHPEDVSIAAYVDWLRNGAPPTCPVPEVRSHVADCRHCFSTVEDLLVMLGEADRAAEPPPLGSFVLQLARDLGRSFVEWSSLEGSSRREFGPSSFQYSVTPASASPSRVMESMVFSPAPPSAERWPTIPLGDLSIVASLQPTKKGSDVMLTIRRRDTQKEISGLRVHLLDEDGEELQTKKTDLYGRVKFQSVSVGAYEIEISQ